MSARRRQGRTADDGGTLQRPVPVPALPAEDDDVVVGDQVVAAARPAPPAPPKKRAPFGSYLDKDLQRAYKARCVLLGIEMQDALEEAITDWLDKNPA